MLSILYSSFNHSFYIVIVERVVLKVPLGRFCQLMPDDEVSPCNFAYDLLFDNIGERLIEEMVDSFDNFFDKVGEPCASCRWREIYGGCRAKAFYMLQDARKGQSNVPASQGLNGRIARKDEGSLPYG